MRPITPFFQTEDALNRRYGEGFCDELVGFINEKLREKFRSYDVEIEISDVLNKFPVLGDTEWSIPHYISKKFTHEGWRVDIGHQGDLKDCVLTFYDYK